MFEVHVSFFAGNLKLYHCNVCFLISFADSSCAFSAQGSGSGMMIINSSPVVFEQVDLNICDGYDVATGMDLH